MSIHDARSLTTPKPPRFPIEAAFHRSTYFIPLNRATDKLTNLAIGRLGNGTLSLHDALGILILTSSLTTHALSRSATFSLLSMVKANVETSKETLGIEEKKVLLVFAREIVKVLRPKLEKKAATILGIDTESNGVVVDEVCRAISSATTKEEKVKIALLGMFHPESAMHCASFLSSLTSTASEEERIKLSKGAASLSTALSLIEQVSHRRHRTMLTVVTPDIVQKLNEILEF